MNEITGWYGGGEITGWNGNNTQNTSGGPCQDEESVSVPKCKTGAKQMKNKSRRGVQRERQGLGTQTWKHHKQTKSGCHNVEPTRKERQCCVCVRTEVKGEKTHQGTLWDCIATAE